MTSKSLALAAAALAALALCGCGRQGALERPQPRSGHLAQPTAEEKSRREAAYRARMDTVGIVERQAPQSADELRGLGLSEQQPAQNAAALSDSGAPQAPDRSQTQDLVPDPVRASTSPE